MTYEHEYLSFQNLDDYESALTNYHFIPSTFDASSTPLSVRRRQSFASFSSDMDSELSIMTPGPVTPLGQINQNLSMGGFSPSQAAASPPYEGMTSLVGFPQLGSLAEDVLDTALNESLEVKKEPAASWNDEQPTIYEDASLALRLYSGNDFGPPSTPLINEHAYYTNALYTSPNFLTPSVHLVPGHSHCLSSNLSPEEVCYPLTPSSLRSDALGLELVNRPTQWEDLNIGYVDPSALGYGENKPIMDDDRSCWSTEALDGDMQSLKLKLDPSNCPRVMDALDAKDGSSFGMPEIKQALPTGRCKSRKDSAKSSADNGFPAVITLTGALKACKVPGCASKFRRPEHATRHFQTVHGKVFHECIACTYLFELKIAPSMKLFNRADNMKQHVIKCHFTPALKGRVERLVDESGHFKPKYEGLLEAEDIRSIWNDFHRYRDKKINGKTAASKGGPTRRRITAGAGTGSRSRKKNKGLAESLLHASAVSQLPTIMED